MDIKIRAIETTHILINHTGDIYKNFDLNDVDVVTKK